MGEKWKQARRTGRVDGEMMLSIYIFALLIFPMTVSYTHLDVYKRQKLERATRELAAVGQQVVSLSEEFKQRWLSLIHIS